MLYVNDFAIELRNELSKLIIPLCEMEGQYDSGYNQGIKEAILLLESYGYNELQASTNRIPQRSIRKD